MVIKDGIAQTDERVLSFLMIGQSNMAGRGDFGEVEPIINPRCLMLRMGRWQMMSEPINPDRSVLTGEYHSGVGLAASFADETQKLLGARIGLIPCADGGTSMDKWSVGSSLYDHAIFMAKLAMRSSTLAGIIWHQGESDCHRIEDALAHREKFLTMITALRRELGAESLPLIIGELPENITEKWGVADRPQLVNRAYRELAAELPVCAIASSQGLELRYDGIHFSSASARIFGKRYFEAYRSLIEK